MNTVYGRTRNRLLGQQQLAQRGNHVSVLQASASFRKVRCSTVHIVSVNAEQAQLVVLNTIHLPYTAAVCFYGASFVHSNLLIWIIQSRCPGERV